MQLSSGADHVPEHLVSTLCCTHPACSLILELACQSAGVLCFPVEILFLLKGLRMQRTVCSLLEEGDYASCSYTYCTALHFKSTLETCESTASTNALVKASPEAIAAVLALSACASGERSVRDTWRDHLDCSPKAYLDRDLHKEQERTAFASDLRSLGVVLLDQCFEHQCHRGCKCLSRSESTSTLPT